MLYSEIGNTEKAIGELREVLKKYPETKNLWFAMGNIYNKNNKETDAIDAYNKVITIDTAFTPAYQKLMEIYIKKGDVNKALEIFEQAQQNIKDPEQIGYLSSVISNKQEDTNK